MQCVVFILLAVLFIAVPAVAQKTKPWTEWTEKEAAKVLNESAWGQTQTEVAEAGSDFSFGSNSDNCGAQRGPANFVCN